MKKINIKGIMNKISTTLNKGVDVYANGCARAEEKMLSICKSKHTTLDNVVDEVTCRVGSIVKDKTVYAACTLKHSTTPARRAVVGHVIAAKDKTVSVVVDTTEIVVARAKSMMPKKKQPVPMCRPVSHTQQCDAPAYTPPICKAPASMTTSARMQVFVDRGKASIPMAICKTAQ